MKNRIKIIRRIGMPETNSSSSHAVSISMGDNYIKPGDPEWDVDIEDGILKIPNKKDGFGWEYFKTNTLLTKLQYLCGIFCSDIKSGNGKKRIVKLKKILRELFDVRDVEFLWITEFKERLKEVEDPEDAYYDYPEIDHNSHDIFEEITESKEVIKNYLFSRDSWLYGGNDNSDAPIGFYNEPITSNKVTAIISAYFPEPFGRIDWELYNFPNCSIDIIDKSIGINDDFNILDSICYDTVEGKFKEYHLEKMDDIKNNLTSGRYLTYYGYYYPCPIYLDNGYYIFYTDHNINKEYSNLMKSGNRSNRENVLRETLSKFKEGVDYKKVLVSIKLLEYKNYEV